MEKPKRTRTKVKEDLVDAKLKKLEQLEKERELKYCLPHKYGMKFYSWARTFYNAASKDGNFLCAGNQISKSSTQHRKCINWATDIELQKKLWNHRPRIFWYMYPSMPVADTEFLKKIEPDWMPRGKMKDDPVYGWNVEKERGLISAINFNSGVTVYFKTYSIDVQSLQSSSVDAIFLDEECPPELLPELQSRMYGTDGYLNAVLTPTIGTEYWRCVIEENGEKRIFPNSHRQKVSMYDCLVYEDGSPSHWTLERIKRIEASCKSPQEIRRRVYGDFVIEEGLKYPSFDPAKNVVEPFQIPLDYYVYIGVDMGSGGDTGHPAAVCFTAVSPDFKKAYIYDGKRFDGVVTVSSDIVNYVIAKKKEIRQEIVGVFYDFHAVDLKNIAISMGESWIAAEKSHAIGEHLIGVCFKNEKLSIFRKPELMPLVQEFKSLKANTGKRQAVDDMIDSARYSLTKVPFDYSDIGTSQPTALQVPKTALELEMEQRRRLITPNQNFEEDYSIDKYFEEWQDYYELP